MGGEVQSGARLQSLTRVVEAGLTILREDSENRDMLVLLSGTLGVYKNGKKVAVIDKPGSYVGEMGALLGGPRTASVRSETRCSVVWVPADQVAAFFQHSPDLGLKLARTMAHRLRDTTRQLAETRGRSARLRAAWMDVIRTVEELRELAVAAVYQPAAFRTDALTRLNALLRKYGDDDFKDETVIL